jgi:hypothetical protein
MLTRPQQHLRADDVNATLAAPAAAWRGAILVVCIVASGLLFRRRTS